MSITGALLNQLLEKHGLSQDMIQTKKYTIDWLLEGFPETPVVVVRIIAGKLYREAGFVQDLKDHWREATDTLEEASMVFHIYRDSPYEPDEIDSSLDEDFGDKDFRNGEDGESDAPMYLSTWRYSLHGSRNEIWWTGTEEIDTFRSESDVCHAPAKETNQIEFAGKAIQILPGTIDPKDFPCLKPIQDGNYQLVPVIPTETSLIAVDGLEIFFLWDLFKEQYEIIFSFISATRKHESRSIFMVNFRGEIMKKQTQPA